MSLSRLSPISILPRRIDQSIEVPQVSNKDLKTGRIPGYVMYATDANLRVLSIAISPDIRMKEYAKIAGFLAPSDKEKISDDTAVVAGKAIEQAGYKVVVLKVVKGPEDDRQQYDIYCSDDQKDKLKKYLMENNKGEQIITNAMNLSELVNLGLRDKKDQRTILEGLIKMIIQGPLNPVNKR